MVKLDRPEVKRITKEWVRDNCRSIVTDRDMEILKLLNAKKRRLLRRDQIQALLPGLFPNEDRLQRRLKQLYSYHIIDRICPKVGLGEGSSKQYICLDRAGVILLGEDYNEHNKMIVDNDGNKSLISGWRHRVAINDYEILVRDIVNGLGGKVLQHKTEKPVPYGNNTVIPDLFFMVHCDGRTSVFFVEVDRGSEDVPFLAKKFDKYRECFRYKQWMKMEWAKAYAKAYGSVPFPKVLLFTEDGRSKRVESLRSRSGSTQMLTFIIDYHCNAEETIGAIIKR
jgi:hypothetical protein